MKQHIFIEKAFRYPIKHDTSNINRDYAYLEEDGFWVNKTSGIPLIEDAEGPRPDTKKCDEETGEDKKGE